MFGFLKFVFVRSVWVVVDWETDHLQSPTARSGTTTSKPVFFFFFTKAATEKPHSPLVAPTPQHAGDQMEL